MLLLMEVGGLQPRAHLQGRASLNQGEYERERYLGYIEREIYILEQVLLLLRRLEVSSRGLTSRVELA